MASTTTSTVGGQTSLIKTIATPFVWLGRAIVVLIESGPKVEQLNRLSRTSDAELRQKGLTRDSEIRRILGSRMYF